MKSESETAGAKARLRARLWLLLTLVGAFLVVVFLFPLVLELRIDVPSQVQFGNASSVMFEIANQNFTALTNVEYSCEVSNLITASGSRVKDVSVMSRGRIPKIGARRGVTGRCQTGYLVTAPLKTVEYRLTVTYHAYPWPQQRTRVAQISGKINGDGAVTGWKVE